MALQFLKLSPDCWIYFHHYIAWTPQSPKSQKFPRKNMLSKAKHKSMDEDMYILNGHDELEIHHEILSARTEHVGK
jgi:hypothetical protein